MPYTEERELSKPYRDEILSDFNNLLTRRRKECDEKRREFITPEKYRADPVYYKMALSEILGWPLSEFKHDFSPEVEETFVAQDEDASIYRVRITIFPDYRLYGLLFIPNGVTEKTKCVVALHGGDGTPELAAGIWGESNYTDMTMRCVRRGAVTFSPQLLVWKDVPRVKLDARLKHVGGSATALEVFSLKRAIDWLTTLPEVDSSRIGMMGLSYGGFYTLMTSALEPRIKSAYSSCFINDRYTYDWPDFLWFGAAGKFKDAEIAALTSPRALFLEAGGRDILFSKVSALNEIERVIPYFPEGRLKYKITEEGHKLDREDDGYEFFFENLQ